MSTANYRTMDNFSLFVREDQDEAKRCPECGAIMDADATACDLCGCEELEDYYFSDEVAWECDRREIERELDDLNYDLMFHKISLVEEVHANADVSVEVYDLDVSDFPDDGEQDEADKKEVELEELVKSPGWRNVW